MANQRPVIPKLLTKFDSEFQYCAEYCESSSEGLSDDSYSYSDEYYDDSDDYNSHLLEDGLLLHIRRICENHAKKGAVAAKNAEELVAEEEREKRKAEKRKAKKKRRREKKKEGRERTVGSKNENVPDKQDTSERKCMKSIITGSEVPSLSSRDDIDDGEEFLDVNSAFVSVAVSKKKKNGIVPSTMEKSRSNPKKSQVSPDQSIAESERLAIIGYKMASKENYDEAVEYFTKAIKLVHNDHRFFSNRSFCHCHLGNYIKALKDADKAIALASNNPKGYYRRGEALKGLNQFKEAEEAFTRVVSLDEECEDAMHELAFVRLQQLLIMGYDERQVSLALDQYCSEEAALNALSLSHSENVNCNGVENNSDMCVSDEEDKESVVSGSPLQQTQENGAHLNQLSLKANKMEFGVVLSVRLLPEKYCAFINFRDKTSPGPAMKTLQNRELGGERLLIRYPNNPVPEAHQQIIVKKTVKCPTTG